MLTKLNTGMSEESVNGLRSTKAAVQEYGHASKVPITLEMMKLVQNSYRLYSQHLREEQEKKKHEERKRNKLRHTKENLVKWNKKKKGYMRLDQLTSEHGAAKEAMQRSIIYIEEGGEKIKNALKVQDMMEVEAGNKLVEFGKEKQNRGYKQDVRYHGWKEWSKKGAV